MDRYFWNTPNISLNTIVIDKDSPLQAMYVGMDVGVYYKDNTMADWALYATGLPNTEVTELEIHYNAATCNSTLYAATYGQGLWKSDLRDPGNVAVTACFSASETAVCLGEPVIFTDNSSYTPTSWTWTVTPATYTFEGGTNANSQNPQISFTAAGNYTIELTASNATGPDTETKAAYITVSNAVLGGTVVDDFEAEPLCATTTDCAATVCSLSGFWTNLSNGTDDNIDWRTDEGGTPSSNTGPSVDYNPGTAAGNYLYLEASGGCTNQTAILESGCVNLDQDYIFELAYHMNGGAMGSLHLDIFTGGVWVNDFVPSISGNQGTSWNVLNADLTPYTGQTIKLRVRGVTGTGFESDMAIDDLKFTVNLLDVEEPTVLDGLMIYPNPVSNLLTIANPKQLVLKNVTLYDITGRLINTVTIDSTTEEKTIDVSHLSNGIYMITISGEQGTLTKKLVKK